MPLTLSSLDLALNNALPSGTYQIMLLDSIGESVGLDSGDISIGSASIAVPGNTLEVGSGVVFSTAGTLYSPLLPNTAYRVVSKGPGDLIQLSRSVGGTPIVITDAGSGTHNLISLEPVAVVGAETVVAFSMQDLIRYEIPTYATGTRPTSAIGESTQTIDRTSRAASVTVDNTEGNSTVEFRYVAFIWEGSTAPGDTTGSCRAVVAATPSPIQVPAAEQRQADIRVSFGPC